MVDKKTMDVKKPVNFDRLPADLKRKIEEDVSRRQLIWDHGYGLDRYREVSRVSPLTESHPPKTKCLSGAEEDQLQEETIDESIDELSNEEAC